MRATLVFEFDFPEEGVANPFGATLDAVREAVQVQGQVEHVKHVHAAIGPRADEVMAVIEGWDD